MELEQHRIHVRSFICVCVCSNLWFPLSSSLSLSHSLSLQQTGKYRMHLRSPSGPISVYVLNPSESDSEQSLAKDVTVGSSHTAETQVDSTARGGW